MQNGIGPSSRPILEWRFQSHSEGFYIHLGPASHREKQHQRTDNVGKRHTPKETGAVVMVFAGHPTTLVVGKPE